MGVLTGLDGGKYAAFVLAAYGISAITLLALAIDSLLRTRRWRGRTQDRKSGPKP